MNLRRPVTAVGSAAGTPRCRSGGSSTTWRDKSRHVCPEPQSPSDIWLRAPLALQTTAHTSHRIDVRLEHEMTDEMFGYQDIGGDTDEDMSFKAYFAGRPGLALGKRKPDADPEDTT